MSDNQKDNHAVDKTDAFDSGRELQSTFHDTVMRSASSVLRTPDDWKEVGRLQDALDKGLDQLKDDYQRDYNQRVDQKRQEFSNDPSRLEFDHPAPIGAPPLSLTERIELAAHKAVQDEHKNDLARFEADHDKNMFDLVESARSRDSHQGKARDAFERSADRRSGEDRRAPSRSR